MTATPISQNELDVVTFFFGPAVLYTTTLLAYAVIHPVYRGLSRLLWRRGGDGNRRIP